MESTKPDEKILKRIERGRKRADERAGMREMCIRFMRSEQYLWLSENGQVYNQRGSVSNAVPGQREAHRIRQTRNIIKPIVDEKVSQATQRVPGYQVNPATLDYEDVAAANLAQKVLLAGYENWRVRRAVKDVVWYALVADEGFAYAYWDSSVGPFVEIDTTEEILDPTTGQPAEIATGSTETIGQGEIKIRTFGGSQVFWEPGENFEDSRWHAVDDARAEDTIKQTEGYIEGELTPDARERGKSASSQKMVRVTDYFERPSKSDPKGRRTTMANDRVIFPPEPFPLTDANGEVTDEPALIRLSYTIDPDSDRDEGIVRHLIDAQRSYNDVNSKLLEWKNLALVPQMIAPKGSIEKRPSDAPGEVVEYEVMPGQDAPQWRNAPAIPQELFQLKDDAKKDMEYIAHAERVQADAVRSSSEAQTLIESNQAAWASFVVDLAAFHSRLARDCLVLVQRHYTEPRLLRFRGRLGWEPIADFRGADIHSQTDVRVLPGSIEPRTRTQVEQKIMNYAQLGWIGPDVAISAIEGGTAENLIDRFDDEVGRVHRIIMQIKTDVTALYSQVRPTFPQEQYLDPTTGTPATEVPSWMPRPFDNADIQMGVLEQWFKTEDYEVCNPEQKEAAHLYYAALLELQAQAAQRQAEMQSQQAEQMGMRNAQRPPAAKPSPSLPGITGNTNGN